MQPYFFPYLGYFSLIEATDHWVIFDDIQYIRHGWVNRNRILKPSHADWQYINVPLQKHPRSTKISEVQVTEDLKWKKRILGQIQHYKKIAPYYHNVQRLIEEILAFETNSIVHLNAKAIATVCSYIGIKFHYQIYSEMPSVQDKVHHAGEWALEIAKQTSASTYINPINGRELFKQEDFTKANVQLLFLKYNLSEYQQPNDNFIAGLSVIDALMFNSSAEVFKLVQDYTLQTSASTTILH